MNLVKQDDWESHWSKINKMNTANPASKYRYRLLVYYVQDIIKKRAKTSNILDFGSGCGDLIQMLSSRITGPNFIGFELSRSGVDLAQKKVPAAKFFQCNLLLDEPAQTNLYRMADIAICSEVLEHLDEPQIMLGVIKKYLAPGASIIITVPRGPMNSFEKFIGHRKHYHPNELSSLITNSGFIVKDVIKAGFPFFNLYKFIAFKRSKKLLDDIGVDSNSNLLMRTVLKCFDALFYFNIRNFSFGWQLVLIAENPSD